jgi:hypothetical protein
MAAEFDPKFIAPKATPLSMPHETNPTNSLRPEDIARTLVFRTVVGQELEALVDQLWLLKKVYPGLNVLDPRDKLNSKKPKIDLAGHGELEPHAQNPHSIMNVLKDRVPSLNDSFTGSFWIPPKDERDPVRRVAKLRLDSDTQGSLHGELAEMLPVLHDRYHIDPTYDGMLDKLFEMSLVHIYAGAPEETIDAVEEVIEEAGTINATIEKAHFPIGRIPQPRGGS